MSNWPQYQCDAQRTGHSPDTLGSAAEPIPVLWRKVFTPTERVLPQVLLTVAPN